MNFIDLATQQKGIRSEIMERIETILAHGKYIMGPEVKELEEELAKYVGVKNAVSCSSGTDALLIALMALEIGKGDAVITTPFTFVATAEVINVVGATPVFIDIDPKTYNIDPAKIIDGIDKAKKMGLNPKAIIPVDLFGLPADYDAIGKIAGEHGLKVIEDACQGFGGEYKGRKLGGFGEFSATSFFPAKPLGCYGDGGAVFTDDDSLADIARSIRVHGSGSNKYDNVRIGLNGRMDTIQAGILLPKLSIFPGEVDARQKVAAKYSDLLKESVEVPQIPDGMRSAWAQYSILSDRREEIQAKLKEAGIPTAVYYPIPLHMQTAYGYLGYSEGDMPVSEAAAKRIFSLPMHPYLTDEEIEKVASAIKEA
jgi:dTDP-4-amino-4,6-dideoxygalactose transaminase